MYINHGGIGLTLNAQGELDGLRDNEMRCLNLREGSTGKVIAHQMPSTPWTAVRIAKALQESTELFEKCATVDAYLGDEYLGSTEL